MGQIWIRTGSVDGYKLFSFRVLRERHTAVPSFRLISGDVREIKPSRSLDHGRSVPSHQATVWGVQVEYASAGAR
jgi:hypothetical protein